MPVSGTSIQKQRNLQAVYPIFAAKLKTMYTIKFEFEQKGKEPVTIENVSPDQSLLEVALTNDIELHHNCGGVCACSTCHLYVNQGEEFLEELSDKEEDFIDRAINPKLNSRLGCQCVLHPGGGVVKVTLPDQSQFLGE
jgi:ferredoxin, 2Fe-2S